MSTLNNTSKEMFINRNSGFSTHSSRRGVNLLGWEEPENLSPEEMRKCLVAHKNRIVEELMVHPKGSPERKRLAIQQQIFDARIAAIRPRRKCPGVEKFFIDVAKEELTKFEFDRWMTMAAEKWRAEHD